jgi:hypothetical protein
MRKIIVIVESLQIWEDTGEPVKLWELFPCNQLDSLRLAAKDYQSRKEYEDLLNLCAGYKRK